MNALAFLHLVVVLSVAVEAAKQVASKLDLAVRVVNMRFVKPLDEQIIRDLADKTSLFVDSRRTCSDGGAGSAVNVIYCPSANSQANCEILVYLMNFYHKPVMLKCYKIAV